MKFSCIKLKRRKENVVYVNDGHVIATMNIQKSCLIMEETFPDKRIIKKLTKEGKSLALAFNKSLNPQDSSTEKKCLEYH